METRADLFDNLCGYVKNTRYGDGYEFNLQMWAAFWTIYITKNDVELTSFSSDTPEETLRLALDYLIKIKAKKA